MRGLGTGHCFLGTERERDSVFILLELRRDTAEPRGVRVSRTAGGSTRRAAVGAVSKGGECA